MGGVDYSAKARVYALPSNFMDGEYVLKEKLGETERRVINAGACLGDDIAESGIPLPAEVLVTPQGMVLSCGKAFRRERDVTGLGIASDLSAIVQEGAIRYICVRRLDRFQPTYISYGRRGCPEYIVSVYSERGGSRKGGDA